MLSHEGIRHNTGALTIFRKSWRRDLTQMTVSIHSRECHLLIAETFRNFVSVFPRWEKKICQNCDLLVVLPLRTNRVSLTQSPMKVSVPFSPRTKEKMRNGEVFPVVFGNHKHPPIMPPHLSSLQPYSPCYVLVDSKVELFLQSQKLILINLKLCG